MPSSPTFSPLPDRYDDLIEGQPLSTGAYPGFVAGLHLQSSPAWQDEFGKHRCFRVVGFAHALAKHGIPFSSLRKTDHYLAAMRQLTPEPWSDSYFTEKDWSEFRATQLTDAYRSDLQRFDKAALSIVYLATVFIERGLPVEDVSTMVRIRAVTYSIKDFERAFSAVTSVPTALNALCEATGKQAAKLFSEMALGLTFVTRKTADTAVAHLQTLETAGQLPAGTTGALSVECALRAHPNGSRKRVWSSKEERIWYAPMEYLSPHAWNSLTPAQQAAVPPPPLARNQWLQVA